MHSKRVIFKWLTVIVAIIMLLQSALILPSVSAHQLGPQTCDMTGIILTTAEEVRCRLLPEIMDPSPIDGQDSFAPATPNILESSTGTPTVPWSIQVGQAGTYVKDITTDTNGYVYITGYVNLENDTTTFVTKLDNSGDIV